MNQPSNQDIYHIHIIPDKYSCLDRRHKISKIMDGIFKINDKIHAHTDEIQALNNE